MVNKMVLKVIQIISCMLVCFFVLCTSQKESVQETKNKATDIIGNVTIYKARFGEWQRLNEATKIEVGDSIKTGIESKVTLQFTKEYAITLSENSCIAVPKIESNLN